MQDVQAIQHTSNQIVDLFNKMKLQLSIPYKVQPWISGLFQNDSSGWTKYVAIATGSAVGFGGIWYLWKRYQDRNLPDGPTGWPYLGITHLVSEDDFENDLAKIAKTYGDVFSFHLAGSLYIILASESAMKEAFVTQGEVFACRPNDNLSLVQYMDLKDDITATPYQTEGWKENKSLLLQCLRGAGFGSTRSTEDKILEQSTVLNTLLESLSRGGKAIDLRDILPKATLNIIYQILFGKSFEYDDPKLMEVLEVIRNWIMAAVDMFFLEQFPKVFVHTFLRARVASAMDTTDAFRAIIGKEVDEHINNYDPENLNDFIDFYISKRGPEHDRQRMIDNALIFLPDAADTLALGLEWIILYITCHKDIQDRINSEIDKLTKGNRQVTWADRNHLVLIEATIREVLRLSAPIGITMAHSVSKEVTLRGFRIPTRAKIFALMSHAHRDPTNFPDPDTFKPDRFIDSDGKLMKSDLWSPFSMGRRRCSGEQIVMIELFLLTANLVQSFQLRFGEGQDISLEHCKGKMFKTPQQFKVVLTRRS